MSYPQQRPALQLMRATGSLLCARCHNSIPPQSLVIYDTEYQHLTCLDPITLFTCAPNSNYNLITGWTYLSGDEQRRVQKDLDTLMAKAHAMIKAHKEQQMLQQQQLQQQQQQYQQQQQQYQYLMQQQPQPQQMQPQQMPNQQQQQQQQQQHYQQQMQQHNMQGGAGGGGGGGGGSGASQGKKKATDKQQPHSSSSSQLDKAKKSSGGRSGGGSSKSSSSSSKKADKKKGGGGGDKGDGRASKSKGKKRAKDSDSDSSDDSSDSSESSDDSSSESSSDSESDTGGRKRIKRDPQAPKRAQTGYMFFCLQTGSLISLADGTSVAIEKVRPGSRVLARQAAKTSQSRDGLTALTVTAVMDRGVRPCEELLFSDGRTLTCTVDHRILTSEGSWVEAGDLIPHEAEVAVGMEYPHVDRDDDGSGWTLDLTSSLGYALTMDPARVEQALAFARLLGYVHTQSGIVGTEGSSLMLGPHALDVDAALADVELLTGARPALTVRPDGVRCLALSQPLHQAFLAVGVAVGERSTTVSSLSAFLLAPLCPTSVVREFLGGLFGGDGQTLHIASSHLQTSEAVLAGLSFDTARRGDVAATQMRRLHEQLLPLMTRVGVDVSRDGAVTTSFVQARDVVVAEDELQASRSYDLKLAFASSLVTAFARCVGFRYASHKQLPLTAALAYYRANETTLRQQQQIASLTRFSINSAKEAVEQQQRKEQPLPATRLSQPLLQQLDAMDSRRFFSSATADSRVLPLFRVQLISRRPVGQQRVYDLTVPSPQGDDSSSFVANGVVVHNCFERRPSIVAAHPTAKPAEILELLGQSWKATGDEEKARYNVQRDADKVRYERQLKEYKETGKYYDDQGKIVIRTPKADSRKANATANASTASASSAASAKKSTTTTRASSDSDDSDDSSDDDSKAKKSKKKSSTSSSKSKGSSSSSSSTSSKKHSGGGVGSGKGKGKGESSDDDSKGRKKAKKAGGGGSKDGARLNGKKSGGGSKSKNSRRKRGGSDSDSDDDSDEEGGRKKGKSSKKGSSTSNGVVKKEKAASKGRKKRKADSDDGDDSD